MLFQKTRGEAILARQALTTIALAATALYGCGANAAEAAPDFWSSMFSFNGFGTVGAVRTNSDEAYFVRFGQPRGATTSPSLNVDSNLGLQLTANPTKWLSATVQVLSRARAGDHIEPEAEWAFVKVTPLEGLTVRVGRVEMPLFAISDFRNVGYANTWVRPPNEVYGLGFLKNLDGGDISYRIPLDSTSLTVSALAGKSRMKTWGFDFQVKDVIGLNLQWETDWGTLRLGQVKSSVQIPGIVPPTSTYTFTGVGVTVDRNNLVGQAEYVMRRSEEYGDLVDANGWYMLGGYRYKEWLPYATYAKTKPGNPGAPGHLSGAQSTVALGLRWDALKSTALKFQLERINPQGTEGISFTPRVPVGVVAPPLRAGHVTAVSVSADFVF